MPAPPSHQEVHQAARAIDALEGEPSSAGGVPPFARVLVATDGGPTSQAAVAWGRELAKDATVWVVHVPEEVVIEPRAILTMARAALGIDADHALTAYGDPASAISKLADELRADVVVLGSHGRSASTRLILGSVSDAVRRSVRTSILIARGPPSAGPIVCAVDGSANATRAAGIAARLAARRGTDLTLLHVVPGGILSKPRGWESPATGRLTEAVTSGDPAASIVAEAHASRASLIVMGARGHGRVRSAVMGSVSTSVCHNADASVLVVRGPLG